MLCMWERRKIKRKVKDKYESIKYRNDISYLHDFIFHVAFCCGLHAYSGQIVGVKKLPPSQPKTTYSPRPQEIREDEKD